MKHTHLVVALVGALVGSATAHAAPRDCSKAAIRKQRAEADKAADPAKAIDLLEPMVRDCPIGNAGETASDRGWLTSDLSVAYEKAGRLLDCQRILAPLTHPSSGLSAKLTKALQHNLDRCSKALDTKYAALKTAKCPLAIDQAVASTVAPIALAPKGATAACVALLPGTPAPKGPDDDPDIPNVACPVPTLIWQAAKGTERKALTVADGVLRDDSVCCNLDAIAAGTIDGKTLVRVRGHGRDCNGGTADSDADMIYAWAGNALQPAVDASVAYH